MKKFGIILFYITFMLNSVHVSATEGKKKMKLFEQGQSDLQLGIGFPPLVKPPVDTFLYYGTVVRKTFPPIHLRYEYGVTDNIGVGGLITFSKSKLTYTDNTDPENINGFDYTYFMVGAFATWHQPIGVSKLDPYARLFSGVNITGASPFGPANPLDASKKTFLWSVHVGANYYFMEKLGAYVEVGYGVSIANVGVILKF